MDTPDVIGVIMLSVITNIVVIVTVSDAKVNILDKINAPIQLQCYKQTSKGIETMLHRIKCPMEDE